MKFSRGDFMIECTKEEIPFVGEIIDQIINGNKIVVTTSSEKTKKTDVRRTPLSATEMEDSWNLYKNDLRMTTEEIARKFGYTSLSPIIRQWKKSGIYDSVEHYKALLGRGQTGFPLKRIEEQVAKEGRLSEINISIEDASDIQYDSLVGGIETV